MTVIDNTWTWRQLAPATSPSARNAHDMCWAGDRVILFGGNVSGPAASDETWELVGDEWDQLSPSTTPTARILHRMIYDGSRVLMMGGSDDSASTEYDETWEYVGGDWNELTGLTPIASGTSHVIRHEMVWDEGGSRALALIAATGIGGSDRTWEFSSGDWHLLTLATEFGAAASLVDDRDEMAGVWAGDRFVITAGGHGGDNYTNDVLELVGTNWATTIAFGNPGSFPWRFRHRAVWTGDQAVFFGGTRNSNRVVGPDTGLDDMLAYVPTGATVTALSVPSGPSARGQYAMVWDGTRIILFGGQLGPAGSLTDETWVLEPPLPPSVASIRHTFGLG